MFCQANSKFQRHIKDVVSKLYYMLMYSKQTHAKTMRASSLILQQYQCIHLIHMQIRIALYSRKNASNKHSQRIQIVCVLHVYSNGYS